MALSNEQMFEMVLMYARCDRNVSATVNMYNEQFPDERPVTRARVQTIVRRLRETGTFKKKKSSGRPRVKTTEAGETAVLDAIHQNPHTSSRAIGQTTNMSHQSVLRILHSRKYHPYHLELHQALEETDYERRLAYCNWLECQLEEDIEFTKNVMWSDEASFSRDANVNLHNAHYWSVENPHWLRTVNHQRQFRVNVWCGIFNESLIGPVFLPQHLTGALYLNFLRTELQSVLDDLPLATRRSMWFHQDGAPPHFHADVVRHLNQKFPNHWIGRGGPVSWPPRSPDLTPLDFFLWGYIKSKVYETEPASAADLRNRILQVCTDIPQEMLRTVGQNIRLRVQTCIATEGRHIEHFLPR